MMTGQLRFHQRVIQGFSILLAICPLVIFSCQESDLNPPEIILLGDTLIYVERGSTYNEPGYIATDQEEGVLNPSVLVNGQVNPDVAASYILQYAVVDGAGNYAEAFRRVVVHHSALSQSGTYDVYDTCLVTGNAQSYTAFVTFDTGNDTDIILNNFHNQVPAFDLAAILFGELKDSIIIEPQTHAGLMVSGGGNIEADGSEFEMLLLMDDGILADSCVSVWGLQ